jgi:hypothetical protein
VAVLVAEQAVLLLALAVAVALGVSSLDIAHRQQALLLVLAVREFQETLAALAAQLLLDLYLSVVALVAVKVEPLLLQVLLEI